MIRLFLKQVVRHLRLLFPVAAPNQAALAAVREANDPAKLEDFGAFGELRRHI